MLSRLVRLSVAATALVFAAASGSSQPAQQPQQYPQQQPQAGYQQPPQQTGGGQAGFGGLQGGLSGSGNVAAPNWDIAIGVPSGQSKIEDKGDQWSMQYSDNRGALAVSVMRNPNISNISQLADGVRNDSKTKGDTVTDLANQSFLGHNGVQWMTMNSEQFVTMVIMSHQSPCVYFMIATAKGNKDELLAYFNWATSVVGTMSGGAANGNSCR
jgi:hypothetical protein